MIKKISTKDLRVGMFIHDLNSGWMDHSFFRSRFLLRKEEQLRKILDARIQEVYIDTSIGLDVCAPTLEEANIQLQEELTEAATSTKIVPISRQSFTEEMAKATLIHGEANQVIHSVLSDVRLGKQIQVERVGHSVQQITDSILRNQGALVSLCRIKDRDNYTFQHSVSVATLMVSFCRHMEMEVPVIKEAGIGAMLHDIGKMKIPDHVLNKPAKLTDAEFDIMKRHVDYGLEILKQTPGISPIACQICGEHHERFGGAGYPLCLSGKEISQLGRMAAIVDVYDAITSNRVYHTAMEPPEALKKLFEWSRHHFDEEHVHQFIQAIGIYPVGSLVRLDSDVIAVVVEQGEGGLLHPVVRIVFDIKQKRKVEPEDLDLSNQQGGGNHIISSEDPQEWHINPFDYLKLDLGI